MQCCNSETFKCGNSTYVSSNQLAHLVSFSGFELYTDIYPEKTVRPVSVTRVFAPVIKYIVPTEPVAFKTATGSAQANGVTAATPMENVELAPASVGLVLVNQATAQSQMSQSQAPQPFPG
jgi:hypothetical protein